MSLINPRNLVAPFGNKMAVGAVIVVAIIVAVARIAGSAGDRADDGSGVDSNETAAQYGQQIDSYLKDKERGGERVESGRRRGAPADRQIGGDPFVNSLMKKEPPVRRNTSDEGADTTGGLQDIKKSLGLE